MFLCFFRLSILAFQIGKGHVKRLVTEADSDGVHGPQRGLNFRIADRPRSWLDPWLQGA